MPPSGCEKGLPKPSTSGARSSRANHHYLFPAKPPVETYTPIVALKNAQDCRYIGTCRYAGTFSGITKFRPAGRFSYYVFSFQYIGNKYGSLSHLETYLPVSVHIERELPEMLKITFQNTSV